MRTAGLRSVDVAARQLLSRPRISSRNALALGLTPAVGPDHVGASTGDHHDAGVAGLARVSLVAGARFWPPRWETLCSVALRARGRHVLAPALLHMASNDVGYLIAWSVRS